MTPSLRAAPRREAPARADAAPGPEPAPSFWLGLAGALAVLAAYNLVFFNRYFPLTEGWFSAYAKLIANGMVPYRDFHLFMPPLYPLQLAAFSSVFGESFLALRLVGIGLILSMAAAVYALFARSFPAFVACFATIVSMVYYQSGVAHITYDFTQFVTAYALFSIFFIVKHCERRPEPAQRLDGKGALFVSLAGLFASAAFLVKQSNGAFIAASCGLAVLLGSARWGARYAARSGAVFAASAMAPLALVAGWLLYRGALRACVDQVFFGAIQSKGSLDSILFAWTKGLFTPGYVIQLKKILLWLAPLAVFSWSLERFGWGHRPGFLQGRRLNAALIIASVLLALACVAIPFYYPEFARRTLAAPGVFLVNNVIIVSTAFSILASAVGLALLVLKPERLNVAVFVPALVSLGLVSGNGTSAGIGEISCFLGLGLLLATLMSLRADFFIGKAACLVLGLSYMTLLVSNKYDAPYAWWSVEQPGIRSGLRPADIDKLEGFRLSEETARILAEVTGELRSAAAPGEPVLSFPHMPVFYLLSDRWPDLKAVVHWFDFLPDDKAEEEARRLVQNPPKAIVCLDLPEFVWSSHERLFRHGKRMGQRSIREAIDRLTAGGRYKLARTYDLPNGCVLKVWKARLSALG